MSVKPGTITALSPQRRRTDRVNVFIDGAFAFGLAETIAASLSIGQTLDEAAIAQLQADDGVAEMRRRALNYIANRPRSITEMARYLARKEVPEEVSQQIIDDLCERDYLNDQAFCRYWIEQRDMFKPRSAYALSRELQAKGVDRSTIDRALAGFDDEAAALAAAEQRVHRWAHLPEAEFEAKMGRYLQSRGFHYGIIRDVVDQVWATIAPENG